MGFKSEAQRRKLGSLVKSGDISKETFDELSKETGDSKLPDRVKAPSPAKKKSLLRRKHKRV